MDQPGLKPGRDVAIKVLQPARTDRQAADRLWAEARCAAVLDHPNVTKVYDAGLEGVDSADLTAYVVMELLDGPSLAQRLVLGALPWADAGRGITVVDGSGS